MKNNKLRLIIFASLFLILAFVPKGILWADTTADIPSSFTSDGYNNAVEVSNFVLLPGDEANNTPVSQGSIIYPQIEYRVQFTLSDLDTLADIESVTLKMFYDSAQTLDFDQVFGVSGNNDTDGSGESYVWKWEKTVVSEVVTTTNQTIYEDGYDNTNTTWGDNILATVPGDAFDYTQESTTFTVKVKASKIATLAENQNWHFALFIDDGDVANGEYTYEILDGFGMGWYGELNLPGDALFDWNEVEHGTDYQDQATAYVNNVNFISNGYYQQNIYADSQWDSDLVHPETLEPYYGYLDNLGLTDDPQEFAIRGFNANDFASALQVKNVYSSLGVSDGGTTELGDNYDYHLWLKLAYHFQNATYTGKIYINISDPTYVIENMTDGNLFTNAQYAVDDAQYGEEIRFIREAYVGNLYIDLDDYYSGANGASLLELNFDKHRITGNIYIYGDYTGTLNITGTGILEGNVIINGEAIEVNSDLDIIGYTQINDVSYNSYNTSGDHTEGIRVYGMGHINTSGDAIDDPIYINTNRRVVLSGETTDLYMQYNYNNVRVEGIIGTIHTDHYAEIYLADDSNVTSIEITGDVFTKVFKESNAAFGGLASITGNTTSLEYTAFENLVVNMTQGTSYATIQAAIDAANASDVIRVTENTFDEDLTINVAGLTIEGLQYDMDGSARDSYYHRGESIINGSITLSGLGNNLDGFTIAMTGGETISVNADSVLIDSNRFTQYGGADAIIANNATALRVLGNDFYSTSAASSYGAINLNGDIDQLLVQGNRIDGVYGYGVYSSGIGSSITNSDIYANTIYDTFAGIYMNAETLNDVEIDYNTIVGNSEGLSFNQTGEFTFTALNVHHNAFYANTYGLAIYNANYDAMTLANNTFDDGDSWHVHLEDTSYLTLANVITNNTIDSDVLYAYTLDGLRPYERYNIVNETDRIGYENVQLALDESSDSDEIYLKSNYYYSNTSYSVNTLTITTDNIRLYTNDAPVGFYDPTQAILSNIAADNTPTLVIEADGVTVENFIFRRENATEGSSAVIITGSNVTFDSNDLYGVNSVGNAVTVTNYYDAQSTSSANTSIINNDIWYGFTNGFVLETPSGAGTITNVTFNGNEINNMSYGLLINETSASITSSISSNTFLDNTIDVDDQDQTLTLSTIYSNNTFDGVTRIRNNGLTSTNNYIYNATQNTAYDSLQEAVDDANATETISVSYHVFTQEELSATGTLVITTANITIDGVSGTNPEFTQDNASLYAMIDVQADNVTISDIDFTRSSGNLDTSLLLIGANSTSLSNVSLDATTSGDVIIINDGNTGSYGQAISGTSITNTTISGNVRNAITLNINDDAGSIQASLSTISIIASVSNEYLEYVAIDNMIARLNNFDISVSNVVNGLAQTVSPTITPTVSVLLPTLDTFAEMKGFITDNYVELGITLDTMNTFNALPVDGARQIRIIDGVIGYKDSYTTYSQIANMFTDYIATEAVEYEVDQLPASGDLQISDKAQVEAARASYDALTPTQQIFMDNYTTLTGAEVTISDLEYQVAVFQGNHAAILAETTISVQTSDQAALTSAVDAYDALTTQEQNELSTEIALLNNLQSTIDSLNTTVSNYQTTHAAILAETTGTIQTSDQAALTSAVNAYDALSTQEQNELSTEIALLNNLQSTIDALNATVSSYQTTHAAILAETTSSVQTSDQAALTSAVNAYDALSTQEQNELSTEIALLNNLQSTIDALNATVSSYQTTHAAILAETTSSVQTSDQAALTSAVNAYDALSTQEQNELSTEIALLNNLQSTIDSLNTTVSNYQTTHAAILAETTGTIQTSDQAALTSALDAYDALTTQEQNELATEIALLNNLQSTIDSLNTTVSNYQTTHAAILAETTGTIQTSDQAALTSAVNAYDALSTQEQNELSTEIALLNNLQSTIDALNATVSSYQTTHAAILAETTSSVQTSDQAALTSAVNAYDALSTQEQNELSTEIALLNNLQSTIDSLNTTVSNYQTTHAAILAETTGTIQTSDQAALTSALDAYDALTTQEQNELATEIALLNNLQSTIDSLNTTVSNYQTTHAAILAETTGTIQTSDQAALTSAVDAYDALTTQEQNELSTEIALLNNLQSTIDALNATVSSYQTTHAAILAETTGTIQTSDQAALTSAVDAYDALTTQEQNELSTEIALLNNLQSTIDALNATVSSYQTTHAAILAETTGTIQTSDQAALTSAVDAYDALTTQEQNELATEIALLNNLQSTIDSLNTTVSNYQTTHAAILAETTGTIQTSDQAALTSALDAYNALSTQEQNELSTEIALLNDLQTEIDRIDSTVTTFTTTHSYVLGLTTGTVQASDQDEIDAALVDYNSYDSKVQAELTTEKALLDDLNATLNP